jgi:Ras-related protein Rab-2A
MGDYHYMMKFIIVGDVSVGKTCILKRFETDEFSFTNPPTMGVEFVRKQINIDNQQIMVQIWDTSGEERMFSLASQYYKSSCGVLLVFDVTRKETFDHLRLWVQKINDNANQRCRRILVGNKVDLEFQRVIRKDEAEAFARANNMVYVETSAKTAKNVYEAFNNLALSVFNDIKTGALPVDDDGVYGVKRGQLAPGPVGSSFQLNPQTVQQHTVQTKQGCC